MSLWSKSAVPKELASGIGVLSLTSTEDLCEIGFANVILAKKLITDTCMKSFLQHKACTCHFWSDPPIASRCSSIPFTELNNCMPLDLWLPGSWHLRTMVLIMQYMLDLLLACAGDSMIETEVY